MLIGNEKIQKYFEEIFKKRSFSHSYLFFGPEGIGKKTFAIKIAKKLNEEKGLDIKIIEKGREKIYISEIKEVKNFLSLTPFSKFRILIIDNAHNLTQESSNAFLKILEEPAKNSIIFLITSQLRYLLPTIISRCQIIRFKPILEKEICKFLINNGLDNKFASKIARISNGSIAKAIYLAENFKKFDDNSKIFIKLINSDLVYRFNFLKTLLFNKEELSSIVSDWILFLYYTNKSKNNLPEMEKNKFFKILKSLINLEYILSQPYFNHNLAVENFVINL